MTFEELVEEWRAGWTNQRIKTRAGYESILHKWLLPRFGSMRVTALTPSEVQRFIAWLQAPAQDLAPNTIRRIVGTLNNALNVGVRRGLIPQNPCQGRIDLPTSKRLNDQVVIFEDDIKLLVAAIPEHYRLPVTLAALTGLRAGELWALRRKDIDFRINTLHIEGSISEVYSPHLPPAE